MGQAADHRAERSIIAVTPLVRLNDPGDDPSSVHRQNHVPHLRIDLLFPFAA
ncbi:hypothetical protein sphantq_00817 [Sphingobium sp. AntQ-1]|nr:hypothetical protein sphantq_00817 [Sphingobium sp. AntQ-1]